MASEIQSSSGAHHPTMWKFIEILKCEQSLNEMVLTHLLAGFTPNPQRRTCVESAKRIISIVKDFTSRPVLFFLSILCTRVN